MVPGVVRLPVVQEVGRTSLNDNSTRFECWGLQRLFRAVDTGEHRNDAWSKNHSNKDRGYQEAAHRGPQFCRSLSGAPDFSRIDPSSHFSYSTFVSRSRPCRPSPPRLPGVAQRHVIKWNHANRFECHHCACRSGDCWADSKRDQAPA